jgi:predicted transcriptional regulator
MDPNKETTYVQISARIPSDLAAGLEKAAQREDRTLSAELRRAVRQYLAPTALEGTA